MLNLLQHFDPSTLIPQADGAAKMEEMKRKARVSRFNVMNKVALNIVPEQGSTQDQMDVLYNRQMK